MAALDLREKLTPEALAFLYSRLQQDAEYFGATMLRVTPREGGKKVPFVMKPAQRFLHYKLQEELKERGFIRACIPKARQLGASTYISVRFFHKATNTQGFKTFILTHRGDATANLFKLVRNFTTELKLVSEIGPNFINMLPEIGYSNARELDFPKLGSHYKIGTAEGKDIGVSMNFQALHLSEVALYPDAGDIAAGLMNTVAMAEGTEIIQESTGRGPVGMFYNQCMEAARNPGRSLWRAYFLPWTWDPLYRMEPPRWFEPSDEFLDYQDEHKLDDAQLFWFYQRNEATALMHGAPADKIHFVTKQEYPMTLEECFQVSAQYAFFPPEHISRARRAGHIGPTQGFPSILAVDVGIDGNDPTFLADRQGFALGAKVWEAIHSRDFNVQADRIVNLVIAHKFQVVVVDVTGLGIGLVSALRIRLPAHIPVVSINFAQTASNQRAYANKRAEMHERFAYFLRGENTEAVSIPNDDQFVMEMSVVRWGVGECYRDEKMKLHITAKEKLKTELGGRSTDHLDAAILTTAVDDEIMSRIAKRIVDNGAAQQTN